MILHMVNLTSEATWRAPLDELIRLGPFKVKVALPPHVRRPTARLLVPGGETEGETGVIGIESILDHEVIVVE
jgi:hypothetical protein